MRVSILAAALMASVVSACGSEAPTPSKEDEALPAPAAQAEGPVIEATRDEVELAWKCRGVMSAAFAARKVMKDDLPEELAAISSETAMYWTERAARVRAPGMSPSELDALTASSVRVLATPQAIEGALPEIRACLAAQAGG